MALPEKFHDVLKHEGVVSLTTWSNGTPHVTNTWNSYLRLDGDTIYIPAAGMHSTEGDIQVNNRIILTAGARDVEGFNGYQGTGFRVEGTASFMADGPVYDKMHAEFPFLSRVLAIHVESAKQLL